MLCGCGADVVDYSKIYEKNAFRIIRQADNSGKIVVSYIFPVNSAILSEKGVSEEQIKTYRLFLSTYVNALAEQNKEKAVGGVSVEKVAYFSDVDGIGFSILFDNIEAQQNFFGNEPNQEEDKNQETQKPVQSGFFIKKTEIQTKFPISSVSSAKNLKQINMLALTSWAKFLNLSDISVFSGMFDESVFIYDYATKQTALKSDVCYDDANFHHNVFIKSEAEIENDNKISFFTVYPNTPIWYALAIGITLIGMIIVYFVLKNKKSRKTKEK